MFRFEYLLAVTNRYGETPLHVAVARGHLKAVHLLVGYVPGLGAADSNSGCTALHIAVRFGRNDIVREIVGAIVSAGWVSLLDSLDHGGRTALHYAVVGYRRNEPECIKTLSSLNPGPVKVDTKTSKNIAGESSNSALHLAAAQPKTEVCLTTPGCLSRIISRPLMLL